MQRIFLAALLSGGGALLACSSSSNGSSPTGGSSNTTPVTSADCETRCKDKATSCNAKPSDADQACSQICDSTKITSDQVDCLENKSCDTLAKAESIDAVCPSSGSSGGGSTPPPSSSGGSGSALGGSCTCPNASPSSEGYCAGSGVGCKSGLGCLYDVDSSGKGECVGERCCDNTSACDKDHSLLKACDEGTCTKRNLLGYYCMK